MYMCSVSVKFCLYVVIFPSQISMKADSALIRAASGSLAFAFGILSGTNPLASLEAGACY